MARDTGRFAIGPRALHERRASEARHLVERHVELVLGAVEARLQSGWIGDEHSPLGESRHREAVCHRILEQRRGAPVTAAIVAGRHLLTIDALCDEYFGRSSRDSAPFGEGDGTGVHRVGSATNDNSRGRR
jgi:hypothetical protein